MLVVGSIASLGIIFGGAGYLLSVFRGGTKQEKSEIIQDSSQIIEFYKEQIHGFKEIVDSQNNKISGLTSENGEMKGKLGAAQAQLDKLELIFQNRNPEMEEFMKFMIQATEQQATSHKEMIRILGEIHIMAMDEKKKVTQISTTVQKVEPTATPSRRAEDIKS